MLLPFVIHIPLFLLIVFYHFKRQANSDLKNIYWPALFFKLTAGIFIGILYSHYYNYGGDTFLYHDYSVKLNQLAKENFNHYLQFYFLDNYEILGNTFYVFFKQPRVLFMFKILSPLNFLTFNNYWLNSIYLSFFSFASLWYLGNYLIKQFKIKHSSVAIAFFCFPTFVIWSSGVLKESIIVGIIALLICWFLKTTTDRKFLITRMAAFLILLYIGWQLKFFYIAILLACMGIYSLIIIFKKQTLLNTTSKKLIALSSFLLLAIGLVKTGFAFLNFQYLLDIMYISYRNMISYSREGTYFTFDNLQPTIGSYIYHFPKALLTGLFRPFLWEVSGILTIGESIENIFILSLSLICVYKIIKTKSLNISPESASVILYVIVSAALMAFIAPNWGTLSRYKVNFLLFWVMLLWEYAFPKKWDNRYQKMLFSE